MNGLVCVLLDDLYGPALHWAVAEALRIPVYVDVHGQVLTHPVKLGQHVQYDPENNAAVQSELAAEYDPIYRTVSGLDTQCKGVVDHISCTVIGCTVGAVGRTKPEALCKAIVQARTGCVLYVPVGLVAQRKRA